MYILARDEQKIKDFIKNNPIIVEEPMFCDTETCKHLGKTTQGGSTAKTGGLYGRIRLIQLYQNHWSKALIIDCFFIDLIDVLFLIEECKLVGHNFSYDLHTINCYTKNYWVPHSIDDTVYMSRLCFSDRRTFSFYDCLDYAGLSDAEINAIDKKAEQKRDWSDYLDKDALKYAAYDVIYLAGLYDYLIKKRTHKRESYQLDIFCMRYAIEYSRRGTPINQVRLREKKLDVLAKYEDVMSKLPINPNSYVQVRKYLDSKESDNEALVRMALEGNEKATLVKDARSLSKQYMFLKKYDFPVIRGFYNPSSTITGRWSCTGGDRIAYDNLQQIPHAFLELIEAPDGYVIVYKDYAGLELRMATAYTAEPTMERLMREGRDMHTYTASRIFKVPEESVTKQQRNVGKTLNFLLIYGGSANLARTMIMIRSNVLLPLGKVRDLRFNWFELYEGFEAWHDMHKRHLSVYGYLDVETALGRTVRAYELAESLNIPIQGSGSEVTKMSHYYLKTRYTDENLFSTIHDSNALLVREDVADLWVNRLNECMVDAWYYVIKEFPLPDLPMPKEAEYKKVWRF